MSRYLTNFAALLALAAAPSFAQQKIAITTHHYDTFRTGWNSHETALNPTLHSGSAMTACCSFGPLAKVALDDNVYAQPLVVPDVNIAAGPSKGKHDVVYAVTENNTIYAIDANSATILMTRNLGHPVDRPGACENNGPHVGIESTPVIDTASGLMYLVAYTNDGPKYRIHAIDLTTLNDRVPPVIVSATHNLHLGGTSAVTGKAVFNAAVQRQRPALLLADGNVYAAFGSFCDDRNSPGSRGWVIGWKANTLAPLPSNIVTNSESTSNKHLSSIWMSGSGLAAVSGHIYFTTGNSVDPFYPFSNLSESIVKVTSDLQNVLAYLAPKGEPPTCDPTKPICLDLDLGSGGVMIVPDYPGRSLAVAAGKDHRLFLFDRTEQSGLLKNLDTQIIGECFCGESYYLDNIVTSGGTSLEVWNIKSPQPTLQQLYSANVPSGGGDGGFFTSVSSNGSSNVIIWAVSRGSMNLMAFEPVAGSSQLKLLNQWPAGKWNDPSLSGANSNAVPVVANGHVYVASYKELDIFGFAPLVNRLP